MEAEASLRSNNSRNRYVKVIPSFFWHDPNDTNKMCKCTNSMSDSIHRSIRDIYILEFPCVIIFYHLFMGLRRKNTKVEKSLLYDITQRQNGLMKL